jgi:hypothetical protein
MMECIKGLSTTLAALLSVVVCGLLFWRVTKNRATDWKLATCLSVMTIATSLLLLMASGKISYPFNRTP